MYKLLIILLLLSTNVFSQDVRSTFVLPYVISEFILIQIDDIVYAKISPRRAFGNQPANSLEELEERFNSHLLRDKKIIRDTTISKNTQHYKFYLDYVPYMRVNYDIFTNDKLYFMDYEDYITEYNNIRNFSEQRTDY